MYLPLPATFTQSGIPSVKHHRYLTTNHKQPTGLFFLLMEAHGLSFHQALPLLLSQPVDMVAHVHFRDKMQTSSYPHLLLPCLLIFSRLNTPGTKALNCYALSLLWLLFTLQAACNENYQLWTVFLTSGDNLGPQHCFQLKHYGNTGEPDEVKYVPVNMACSVFSVVCKSSVHMEKPQALHFIKSSILFQLVTAISHTPTYDSN